MTGFVATKPPRRHVAWGGPLLTVCIADPNLRKGFTLASVSHMTNPIAARNAAVAERRAKAEYIADRNARINEAAHLAEVQIGGRVGEGIRNLLVVFYGTDSAQYVDELARAIIAEHGHR